MLTITDAEPDYQRDHNLVKNICKKTISSLIYLLEKCEIALASDFSEKRGYLYKIPEDSRANGLLYSFYDHLYKLMKANDKEQVKQLILSTDFSHFIANDLDIIPLYSDKFNTIENKIIYITAQSSHDDLYKNKYDCKKPSVEAFLRSKSAMNEALEHIKILDYDCYRELHELITDIVICDSQLINAGTCFNTFGFLYVRQLNDNESWLKYFEHLVHEAGHHHLYSVLAEDPLIDPSMENQYFSSPLRQEKRPLNGIYQAMFVLARTIRAFNRMKSNINYQKFIPNIRTHYNNAKNDSSFEDKFYDTYTVIKQHAKLTLVGNSLLESCYRMATQ